MLWANFIFPVAGVVGNFVMRVSAPPTGYTLTTPNAQQVDYAACTLGQDFFSNKFGAYIVVLPVSFIEVKANYADKKVDVLWATSWEYSNQKYVIEKSFDGLNFTPFSTIIPKHTESFGRIDYKVTDYQPFQKVSFYRIKQIDLDGKYSYSKTVVANTYQDGSNLQANIYPNPVKKGEKLTLNLSNFIGESEEIHVALYNTLGVLVYQSRQNMPMFQVETQANWASGTYVVKIMTMEGMTVKKIVVE